MFDTAANRLGLSLTVDCEPLSQPVYVDRDLWAKVVLNLLSNALKFTFEGGITVRLTDTGEGAELAVTDTGTGVPEAEVPHLFERFHRVSGARSRTHEGSGIGLALVAELVALHGGTVSATSVVDRGQHVHDAAALRRRAPAARAARQGSRRVVGRRRGGAGVHRRDHPLERARRRQRPDDADPGRPRGAADPRRRRQRRHPGVRRRAARRRLHRAHRRRRRRRAGAGPGEPARPGAHRRDDAADGRLRAARGAAGRPAHGRRARGDAVGPGGRGRHPGGPGRRRRRLPREAVHGP